MFLKSKPVEMMQIPACIFESQLVGCSPGRLFSDTANMDFSAWKLDLLPSWRVFQCFSHCIHLKQALIIWRELVYLRLTFKTYIEIKSLPSFSWVVSSMSAPTIHQLSSCICSHPMLLVPFLIYRSIGTADEYSIPRRQWRTFRESSDPDEQVIDDVIRDKNGWYRVDACVYRWSLPVVKKIRSGMNQQSLYTIFRSAYADENIKPIKMIFSKFTSAWI